MSVSIGEFASLQQQWSEKTFGPNDVRGPKGPLMHLELEVQEAIKAIGTEDALEELADCLFLLVDATWRSGYWTSDLLAAAMAKLDKNKSREWGDWRKKDLNAPIEHQR